MTLDAAAFRVPPNHPGFPCRLQVLLAELPDSDRQVLSDALADPAIQHVTISRVLKQEGHDVSALVVGKHRRGDCRCGR